MVNLEAVWDRTSEFVAERRAEVMPIVGLLLFVPLALMNTLMPLIEREPNVRNIGLGLVVVALGIVTMWGHLALTALVLEARGWTAAVRTGAGRLPVAVLISLIEMVVVVLAVAPIFVAFAMSGIVPGRTPAGSMPMIGLEPAVFILVYGLAFAIVGLVLLARLLLVDAALVGERRGVSALIRSLSLTRGMTLKLVGVVLLYILVSQVAGLATKTVFGAILGVLTLGDDTATVATIITTTLVALVQTGFTALATVFTARLFIAVRDARETIVELV
ncbi:hypothetical protein AWL63_11980 [Sphingomonas panacis]|uniref:Glycerophosphoryl diester phosphodiesterase membrane domain-containing protein n=1 Tax=Sphingomonas panacis TaxID=1560345 RepID=A0A1B3ZAY8_9SPHN|nr:hypothetical protein [Sphingomonas panacis]AOH84579.1 hypothetical protein AWL63_11980 [Sphingomonas panacis]